MKEILLILLGIVIFFGGIVILILPEKELKVFGILGIFAGTILFMKGLPSSKEAQKNQSGAVIDST